MLNPGVPKCDKELITLETYIEQRKTMNNKFSIHVHNVKTLTYLAIWGSRDEGGGGGLSFHPYLCTCEIRKQYDKNLKSKI